MLKKSNSTHDNAAITKFYLENGVLLVIYNVNFLPYIVLCFKAKKYKLLDSFQNGKCLKSGIKFYDLTHLQTSP